MIELMWALKNEMYKYLNWCRLWKIRYTDDWINVGFKKYDIQMIELRLRLNHIPK